MRISFTELSNVFRWVGDLSEVIPFVAPVNCALFEEPELSILLNVDLIEGEVHIVGDAVYLQCFYQIVGQDTLGGILEVGSHEVIQIDDLVDGVCFIFGKCFHP